MFICIIIYLYMPIMQAVCMGQCNDCYKESHNNMRIYGYMLPDLSPSPNLYKVQSVYNNNVAS